MKCILCTMKEQKQVDLPNALRFFLHKTGDPPSIHGQVLFPTCEEHQGMSVSVVEVEGEPVPSEPRLYDDAVKLFQNAPMTKDEARWVRILHCDMECSAGRIGELYERHFSSRVGTRLRRPGDENKFREEQLARFSNVGDAGRQLCIWAAEKLGEDHTEPPWEV